MGEYDDQHACEFCGHYAYWLCGECNTHQETTWPKQSTLESSHAELLEALKYIQEMLAFYEGSEEKLKGADTLVAVINAQGSDGDFQMMLSEARQAITRATEEKQ